MHKFYRFNLKFYISDMLTLSRSHLCVFLNFAFRFERVLKMSQEASIFDLMYISQLDVCPSNTECSFLYRQDHLAYNSDEERKQLKQIVDAFDEGKAPKTLVFSAKYK